VDEPVHVPRREDKASTQLKRILTQLLLTKTTGLGALASSGVVAAQEMQEVRLFEFDSAIRLPLDIDQQPKGNAGFIAKGARVVHVA